MSHGTCRFDSNTQVHYGEALEKRRECHIQFMRVTRVTMLLPSFFFKEKKERGVAAPTDHLLHLLLHHYHPLDLPLTGGSQTG